jgi:hypothetical protein
VTVFVAGSRIGSSVQGNHDAENQLRSHVDGAIETSAVRMAITDTMEGGQAAFELRSRKYLFKL